MARKKKEEPKPETEAGPVPIRSTPKREPATPPALAKVAKQSFEMRDPSTLRRYPGNAKKGDRDAISESIKENDFYGSCLVQKSTGFVLAGNHKFEEAGKLGIAAIPCMVIDCDDERARKIALADNRTAELGSYDQKALHDLVAAAAASSGGLRGTGFGDTDLMRLRTKLNPPERDPVYVEPAKMEYACPNCGHHWTSR